MRSADHRESEEKELLAAWHEIRSVLGVYDDEFWGLLTGLKPATSTSVANAEKVQNVLVRMGIEVERCGRLLIRWDLVRKRILEEPDLAKECQIFTNADQDRFRIACITGKTVMDADHQSGAFSDQYGFVLGYPGSAVKGYRHYRQIAFPTSNAEVRQWPPALFCCDDVGWEATQKNLLKKSPELIAQADEIRKSYHAFEIKNARPSLATSSNYAADRVLMDYYDQFLTEQAEAISYFYTLLGYSTEDAAFLASGRRQVVTVLDDTLTVYQFNTWNYPSRADGIKAPDYQLLQAKAQMCSEQYKTVREQHIEEAVQEIAGYVEVL